jgi:hypothetical protein
LKEIKNTIFGPGASLLCGERLHADVAGEELKDILKKNYQQFNRFTF